MFLNFLNPKKKRAASHEFEVAPSLLAAQRRSVSSALEGDL
jgi:hypothetical protein